MDINEGERIGIVGKNGAGKTTLANIIFGSLQYDEGSVISNCLKLEIGFVCIIKGDCFQLTLEEPLTV